MKPSEIQKTLTLIFSEHFAKLGYARDRAFDDWFVKRQSEELILGICPRFTKSRGDWDIDFRFGVYFRPIEQELNSLGARTTFDDTFTQILTNKWTFTDCNTNFPTDYYYCRKFEESMNFIGRTLAFSNKFDSNLTEQAVVEQAGLNLKVIEEYSLPWFEKLNRQKVLKELKKSGDDTKQLIAYFYENDFEKVETLIAKCLKKKHLADANSIFYEKLLQAISEKKKSGIKDGAAIRVAEEAKADRIKEQLEKLFVERFIKWRYHSDINSLDLSSPLHHLDSNCQTLYIKDRTENITSGIWLNLRKLRGIWRIEIQFYNSYRPIESKIDSWDGDKLRLDPVGWERWTIKEHLWNELPEDYRFVKRFSETYKCVVYDDVAVGDIPIDINEQTISERINLMLDLMEKHCIPKLEQTVDLNGIMRRLHHWNDDGIRLLTAYYLASDFDKAEALAKSYVLRQKELEDHPFWNKFFQACAEGRALSSSSKEH